MSSNKYTYPCKFNPLAGVHFIQMSGFFLKVPSPEHGTSHNILSNCTYNHKVIFYGNRNLILTGSKQAEKCTLKLLNKHYYIPVRYCHLVSWPLD